jgi:hypothetical protein
VIKIPIKSYPIKKKDVRVYLVGYVIELFLGIFFMWLSLIISYFISISILFIGWGVVGIAAYFFKPEFLYLMSIGYRKRKKYRKQREQQLGKGFFMNCPSCLTHFKNQDFKYCPYCGALL